MGWLLECPVCGGALSRPDGRADLPLDCPNRCRARLTFDEWVVARWHQFEANR